MKKLFSLLLFVTTFTASAQNLTTVEVALPPKDKVIASAITPDDHLYVVTGPAAITTINGREVNNTITILHFDAALKLVAQKEMKPVRYGKGKFNILSVVAVGNEVLLVGKSEITANSTVKTGYCKLNKTTLVPGEKVTDIAEHPAANTFVGADGSYGFMQHAPGKGFAVMISYFESEPSGKLTAGTDYVLVDEQLQVHVCLSLKNNDRSVDVSNGDFYISASGQLLIAVRETDHVDLKEQWWKDEREKAKVANVKTAWSIYRYDPATKTKAKTELKFSDAAFLPRQFLFFESNGNCFVGGFANDVEYRYRRKLVNDTASLGTDARHYFFVQELAFPETELTVDMNDCAKLDKSIADELWKDAGISEEDRTFGTFEGVALTGALQTSQGFFAFAGGSYSDWHWPPYETIKNNKDYKITKNDKGKATSISGPSYGTVRKYRSLFTIVFNPGKKLITLQSQPVAIEKDLGKGVHHAQGEPNTCFTTIAGKDAFSFYYNPYKSGKPVGEISCWNSISGHSTLSFRHDEDAILCTGTSALYMDRCLIACGATKMCAVKL